MNLYTIEVFNGVSWAWEQFQVVAATRADAELALAKPMSGVVIDPNKGIEFIDTIALTPGLVMKVARAPAHW
jgi:hypothetical protein